MTLDDLVGEFNTTPFLFIGAGISRRYLQLPDWKGLLAHFACVLFNDSFSYSFYENKARTMECPVGLMPKVAELIQQDFDAKWYTEPAFRNVDLELQELVKNGLSPFKAEMAAFIKGFAKIDDKYNNEVQKLKEIAEKSIAGIITTNYDTFLEDSFQGYTRYIGQNELIFSAIKGVEEIYKIHGSVEVPESIIVTESDYLEFERKGAYLAAKLMTIFIEYPIIFLGYSINDSNILKIITTIVDCLNERQLMALENRFVFVEYRVDMEGVDIIPYTIVIKNKPLTMKKVILADFMILYQALEKKHAKLPVKLLR